MPTCFRSAVLASVLLAASASAADTVMEGVASVPGGQDACLDASVRELGMSAKRVEGERRWRIGPQYLHPSVKAGGSLTVVFEPDGPTTRVRVTATWPGARKPADVQVELEARLVSMVRKLSQICGVVKAEVGCTVTEPAGKPTPCSPGA